MFCHIYDAKKTVSKTNRICEKSTKGYRRICQSFSKIPLGYNCICHDLGIGRYPVFPHRRYNAYRGNSYFSSFNFKRSCLALHACWKKFLLWKINPNSDFDWKLLNFHIFIPTKLKSVRKQIFLRLDFASIGLDWNLRKERPYFLPSVKSTAADKDVIPTDTRLSNWTSRIDLAFCFTLAVSPWSHFYSDSSNK